MKVNRRGCTRIVFELKKVVVKIPNFTYSWEHFLKGLINNISENKCWKYHDRKDLMCPVLFCSWGGWFLIMEKAEVTDQCYIDFEPWIIAGLGGDDKNENYGLLKGKIVKIDYQ